MRSMIMMIYQHILDKNMEGLLLLLNSTDNNKDEQDFNGNTYIHLAVLHDRKECLRVLINHNCNINIKNKTQQTPIQLGIIYERAECVSILLQTATVDLNVRDPQGRSLLSLSLYWGVSACTVKLLEAGVSVDSDDIDGSNALHMACKKEQYTLVKNLIRLGCAVDKSDKNGWTPLHVAAWRGNKDCVNSIIVECRRRRMSIESKDKYGMTPLLLVNGDNNDVRQIFDAW